MHINYSLIKIVILPLAGSFCINLMIGSRLNAATFKYPWTSGTTWQVTKDFHENYYGVFNALDFQPVNHWNLTYEQKKVLAPADGTIKKVCKDANNQSFISINTALGDLTIIHLAASTVTLSQGSQVKIGDYLGQMVDFDTPNNLKNPCGVGDKNHLHIEFPQIPFTIDGDYYQQGVSYLYKQVQSTNGNTEQPPPPPPPPPPTLPYLKVTFPWGDEYYTRCPNGEFFVEHYNTYTNQVTKVPCGKYSFLKNPSPGNFTNSKVTAIDKGATTSGLNYRQAPSISAPLAGSGNLYSILWGTSGNLLGNYQFGDNLLWAEVDWGSSFGKGWSAADYLGIPMGLFYPNALPKPITNPEPTNQCVNNNFVCNIDNPQNPAQSVPEPSLVLSLFGISLLGLKSLKKSKQ